LVSAGEPSALRFAIEGDADAALRIALRGAGRGEAIGEGDGEREGIKFAEEPLHRRLVRRDAIGEAQRGKDSGGLALAPLGDGEDRKMVGQERGNGEGEDGGEGKAAAVRATRVREVRKGGEQVEG